IWTIMSGITAVAAFWSWRRYRRAFQANDPMTAAPATRSETMVLALVSVTGVGVAVYCFVTRSLLIPPWRELGVVWLVGWVGAASIWLSRLSKVRRPFTETAMLSALALCCAGFAFALWPSKVDGNVRVVWIF